MLRVVDRSSTLEVVGLLAGLLLLAACSGESPATTSGPASAPGSINIGSIDIAVGDDVRTFGLHQAKCEVVDAGGVRFLNVVAPAANIHIVDGVRTRPNLLTARLPADLGQDEATFGPDDAHWGAIASVAGAEYDGEEYPLLQIIAQTARDGAPGYECRASRDGAEISVVCNGGKVFPWSAPGLVPSGSFKATVNCNKDNGN